MVIRFHGQAHAWPVRIWRGVRGSGASPQPLHLSVTPGMLGPDPLVLPSPPVRREIGAGEAQDGQVDQVGGEGAGGFGRCRRNAGEEVGHDETPANSCPQSTRARVYLSQPSFFSLFLFSLFRRVERVDKELTPLKQNDFFVHTCVHAHGINPRGQGDCVDVLLMRNWAGYERRKMTSVDIPRSVDISVEFCVDGAHLPAFIRNFSSTRDRTGGSHPSEMPSRSRSSSSQRQGGVRLSGLSARSGCPGFPLLRRA